MYATCIMLEQAMPQGQHGLCIFNANKGLEKQKMVAKIAVFRIHMQVLCHTFRHYNKGGGNS